VSPRLVFHHFADMEDLYLEVCRLQYERHWRHLPTVPAHLPVDGRIERLVASRSALYERVGPVRRAGLRRSDASAQIATVLARSNLQLADQLRTLFADRLGHRARPDHDEVLAALEAACSFESWDRLRRAQGLTRLAARRVTARTLRALLDS
jgi:AcrR family transcriptional regulator